MPGVSLVHFEELLEAFLGGELNAVSEVEPYRVNGAGKPVGLFGCVLLVDGCERFDANVEALDAEPAAHLLFHASLTNGIVIDQERDRGRPAWDLGLVKELTSEHHGARGSCTVGDDFVALHVEPVVVIYQLAVVADVQRPSCRVSAETYQHALGTTFGNLGVDGDGVGDVVGFRGAALREADHAWIEGDAVAAVEVAGPERHICSLHKPIIEGQHVVLGGLGHEQLLEFTKLLRVLASEIDRLTEIVGYVVELPRVLSKIGRTDADHTMTRSPSNPGRFKEVAGSNPASPTIGAHVQWG